MRRIHQIVGVTGFRGLWAWQIGQSIGIDENITYVGVANFFLGQSIGSGRGILLGGLWALEWAWHIPVRNLLLRIRLRNLNLKSQFSFFDSFREIRVHTYDLIVSELSTFIFTIF